MAAPSAVAWFEYGGMRLHEILLLDGREFNHGKFFIGIGEGGKDFPGDAEIRVVHVLVLCGLGEAESDAAEVGWSGWQDVLFKESITTQIERRSKNTKQAGA